MQERWVARRRFLRFGIPHSGFLIRFPRRFGEGDRGGGTARLSAGRPFPAGVGSDHRPGPSAGAACKRRSTGVSSTGASAKSMRRETGQPPLPVRLIAGLFILKHMHSLSDESLCARWVESPLYQAPVVNDLLPSAAPDVGLGPRLELREQRQAR